MDVAVALATEIDLVGGTTAAEQEIALDLQVAGRSASEGEDRRVLRGQFLGTSLVGAIHQAMFDDKNRPQVISVSWGSAEKFWNRLPAVTPCKPRWPMR